MVVDMHYTATFKKICSAKSADEMRAILNLAKGKIYAEKREEGYEIRDLRPLGERIAKPVSGRGIVYYFGDTHQVVTAKLLAKFDGVVFA